MGRRRCGPVVGCAPGHFPQAGWFVHAAGGERHQYRIYAADGSTLAELEGDVCWVSDPRESRLEVVDLDGDRVDDVVEELHSGMQGVYRTELAVFTVGAGGPLRQVGKEGVAWRGTDTREGADPANDTECGGRWTVENRDLVITVDPPTNPKVENECPSVGTRRHRLVDGKLIAAP